MKKLSKRFKTRLVNALRSGRYKQTTGLLCKNTVEEADGEYCVLGVACKVAGVSDAALKISSAIVNAQHIEEASSRENKAALRKIAYTTIPGDETIAGRLMQFNDTKNKSFKWLAGYIERYL